MTIGAVAALAAVAIGVPAIAETPANMLIIAGQIDDIPVARGIPAEGDRDGDRDGDAGPG